MTKKAIRVENISKKYNLGVVGSSNLRETLTNSFQLFNPFKKKKQSDSFWALNNISFDVDQGEVIGIIGRNGAGKSTLLKVLSKITEPTSGKITLNGRIASLLEVGTGFHPELTGRENIFLNGSILGMTRQEIRSKFDEIVDFSGVEKFLDTPVKRYSSGMYVRLAFAVAAHLEPEILVIDEVLAVGDVEFQKKCLGKMGEVAKGGRTVLFVSHNMGAVRSLCNQVLVLNNGNVSYRGDVDEGVNIYLGMANETSSNNGYISWDLDEAPGIDEFKLTSVKISDSKGIHKSTFSSSENIILEIKYFLKKPISNMRVNIRVLTRDDQILFSGSSHSQEPYKKDKGFQICTTQFPSDFFNHNEYKIWIQAGSPGNKELLPGEVLLKFNIEKFTQSGTLRDATLPGFVAPLLDWNISTLNQ